MLNMYPTHVNMIQNYNFLTFNFALILLLILYRRCSCFLEGEGWEFLAHFNHSVMLSLLRMVHKDQNDTLYIYMNKSFDIYTR